MWSVWEHIYRLYFYNFIICVKQLQVACLSSRITAYIYYSLWLCPENCVDNILMHTGTRWVGDDYVRLSVLGYELVCKDVLHISGIEIGIADSVKLGVHFCILDSLWHIFYTNNLLCLAGYEVGDSSSTGI